VYPLLPVSQKNTTQNGETGNREYTKRRKTKHNTEKLAIEGTQSEEKHTTTQRNWQ
jgi:hypothetical protein